MVEGAEREARGLTRPAAVARLVAVAALTQLVCALALGGRVHPDETHQYLDVAHRAVWGFGTRPHEWYAGMRNAAIPGALGLWFALLRALHVSDARWIVGSVHALVGALSLRVVIVAYDLVARVDRGRAYAVAMVLALWAPWQNLAFRTLGETFSALALLQALAAWEASPRRDVRAGAWLGAAFVARYPAGLFLLPFAAAYVRDRDARGFARWCFGAAVPLGLLGALDALVWGRPWHSVFAYADFNLVRGRAALDYGARPVWFYLATVWAFAPAALLAVALRRPRMRDGGMTLAVALTYLAVMSLLAHKEPRFLLAIVPALVIAAGRAVTVWRPGIARAVVLLAALQSVVVIAVLHHTQVYEGDAVEAAEWVGRQGDVAGVVLLGVSHPGYVHLRRDVPVWGDGRNDPGAALRRMEGAPRVRGTRWAIARDGATARAVRALGWRDVRGFGDVRVLAE